MLELLISSFLSNLSTGIGKVTFSNLYHIVTLPVEDPSASEVRKRTDDGVSGLQSEMSDDEYGASEVFHDLCQPDVWMKRKLGMSTDPLPRPSFSDDTVSELPVMKGEHLPAGAHKKSPEWKWAHKIKTDKRELFNDITGKESNRGKDCSRGKDNISSPEYALLAEYFHLEKRINTRNLNEEDIIKSSQTPAAKKRLLIKLQEQPLEAVEEYSLKEVQKAVKKFKNSFLDTRPNARKWTPEAIEAEQGRLMALISALPKEDQGELIKEIEEIGGDEY